MIDSRAYSRFEPLYGAMYACSSALEQLRRAEEVLKDKKVVADLKLAVKLGQAFLQRAGQGFEPGEITTEDLRLGVILIKVSMSMIKHLTTNRSGTLRKVSAGSRSALSGPLDDLKAQLEPMEEIAEAWLIAIDEKFVARLNRALNSLESTKPADSIPDWRKELESISH